MSNIVKAPDWSEQDERLKVFLAGSIDMGQAENWQQRLECELAQSNDIIIYNPRRDDWDSSWVQRANNPQFNDQVTWELTKLEEADVVVFYFDPNGQAPITLLELGFISAIKPHMMVVCCPDGFWRKGNVEMMSLFCGFTLVDTIEEMIYEARELIRSLAYDE